MKQALPVRLARKYGGILAISLKSRLAYGWEQVLGSLFMLIVMIVFIALWRTTYRVTGQQSLDGFTQSGMLWYLVVTETIVLSMPRVTDTIDAEVKSGDLAYRLQKPYRYLFFHFAGYLGEMLYQAAITFILGGALVWLLEGPPPAGPLAAGGALLSFLLAQTLNFQYALLGGLLAFWVEDTGGIMLFSERAKWILGGLVLPLELFPGGIRQVVEWLPFRYMLYEPARLFVHFSGGLLGRVLLMQMAWILVVGGAVTLLFRAAVRRVNVNGG